MNKILKNPRFRNIVEINFGIFLITLAYYFFLLPNTLVIGGVMGLSIIFGDYIPEWLFLYTSYAILVTVGGILLGKKFLFRSIYGAIVQPTMVFLLAEVFKIAPEYFMDMISDSNRLFVAIVCVGVLNGAGGGFMFKNNATTGGMDVVQKLISKYMNVPMSVAIYVTDGIVILIGLLTFGLERGIFAILAMLLSGKIVDMVIIGRRNRKALYIITTKTEEMKKLIYELLNRGVTILDATGGYTMQNRKMLVSIVNNREYLKIKERIPSVDTEAFAFVIAASEVLGGFANRNNLKVPAEVAKEINSN